MRDRSLAVGIPVLPSRLASPRPVPEPSEAQDEEIREVIDQWEETSDSLRTPPRAVQPERIQDFDSLDDPAIYFNRELSWIDFNWRVLHQARDERVPLFERVRFLSITQSNLDEFVRKRVGGIQRQQDAGVTELSPDGRTPQDQLTLIRSAVREMQEAMSRTWSDHLVPELRAEGVEVARWEDLGRMDRRWLEEYFQQEVYPILTPLTVDRGHPFPFISNQSLSLAVVFQNPQSEQSQFARVKVPVQRGRWVRLPGEGCRVIALEDVVARNIHHLFIGTRVLHVHPFRLTRNMDTQRDDEDAEDLLQMISEELRERRFAAVVRLEVDADMPSHVAEMLCEELEIGEDDFDRVRGFLDFTDVSGLPFPERPDLWHTPWEPVPSPELAHDEELTDGIFGILRERDLLVHHPYDSFTHSVERFVEEAARDPKVLAIKLTLYRTSEYSPVLRALMKAAEAGKQVAVLVEVMARLDEAANIEWGQRLERAGVHVTYGLVGLKTHTKVLLVVREEGDRIRSYAHIGTGNYNRTTAKLYTDFGLLTSDPDICMDLVRLFHYLTGHAPEQDYRTMVIAPRDMRRRFLELVEREIELQQGGGSGRIILKMNAIDDLQMIRALYRASRAGVKVDLVIRGHTRLRPGIPGLSENIRIISIIGRFLEHDRIFCFMNGGRPEVFIGSADWRRRNLVDRVEAVAPVHDPGLKARLLGVLDLALSDNRLAWDLQPDGRYRLREPANGEEERSFHDQLMLSAHRRKLASQPGERLVTEPLEEVGAG